MASECPRFAWNRRRISDRPASSLDQEQPQLRRIYRGTWYTVANSYASGGSLAYSTARGASATFTFSGASVAWVAYRGPNRGSAAVYLDGTYVATVSLYSSTYHARPIVYAANWGANGWHTLRIVNLGTAGHPRVDLDAFVRLYRL